MISTPLNISMKIVELFSPGKTHQDVTWKRESSNALGGATYSVDINDGNETIEYGLNFAASYVPDLFEVSFVRLDGANGGSMEITGTGREFAVFSGMAESIRDFVRRTPSCSALYFTAKEPSRVRTYKIMARRMASELGWKEQPQLARMLAGGWESEDDPVPFMVVRPGAEKDIAGHLIGNN